jgi:exodeoxyribonuclease V alpha subunit
MRGGMKTYRDSPAAARHYVEADRSRADDYYLAEGTGVAQRYVAAPGTGVRPMPALDGDGYEAWVAGVDPATGEPKGRLRHDDRAVRFVEVVVNGPKSWSLAAELHPDISRAYDVAQQRAATQIIGWLAEHATTRVGPRGGQVQLPVAEIEAVTVAHRTSRAGDPHRHLHLQINARVRAEGVWRGIHTVGVRDSLGAINGIGHAAVMTDPDFRHALAGHGFTLDPGTGEVVQLAGYVGAFSARAAQISRSVQRYEVEWRADNPRREPGPKLLRSWDARAWADARPDKVVPRDGSELTTRWVTALRELGYRDPTKPVAVGAVSVGFLDRAEAVGEVLSRLGVRRSAWNAADIRGEVELLIARRNLVTDPGVRSELAEDLTARALEDCLVLVDRHGIPEHIRALTSPQVLVVETDLVQRLAFRAEHIPDTAVTARGRDNEVGHERPDATQQRAVDALASPARLVVIEGPAGAGKTTVLAQTRRALETEGRRLVLVTPSRKAAQVAARQIGADAFSAAWLAHQHGFRWDATGTWTRLSPGQPDPTTGATFEGPSAAARLRPGDLLLVDEAGMLDQDTARALLMLADEQGARVALVGDRHQLPAVGRGGVLDLAARHVHPDAHHTLDTVHRFTRSTVAPDATIVTEVDDEYAALSLAMRTGHDPGAVFNALLARRQIRVHDSDAARLEALADSSLDPASTVADTSVVADTREQAAALNAAIRDRRVGAGLVSDRVVATTTVGERLGAGDIVATRRNDTALRVANRDQWTVTAVHDDGALTVTGTHGQRVLPAAYVREQVQLAYASTVHGAQGDTTSTGHLVVGEHTGAAAAYVGMTRGRTANTAHLVADSIEEAREQWVAVFARDRADLGPSHAARLAQTETDHHARLRPLADVLEELRHAWTVEADTQNRLEYTRARGDLLRDIVAISSDRDATLPPLNQAYQAARATAHSAAARLSELEPVVTAHATQLAAALKAEWNRQRGPARDAARIVDQGPGRFGQRRAAVRAAHEHLADWSARWQPALPVMPSDLEQVAYFAARADDTPRHHAHLDDHARGTAEHAHPDYLSARDAAHDAREHEDAAWSELRDTTQHYRRALQQYGALGRVEDPAERLAHIERAVTVDETTLTDTREQITALHAEPTVRTQPGDVLDVAHAGWAIDREQAAAWKATRVAIEREQQRAAVAHGRWGAAVPESPTRDHGPSMGR